ncbi:antitoxin Xre/MbcA/ParS toxin-binding domain-containing protein [Rathayibacter soli]|uniref:antitoxin Xre/MbcA/ParS toxin-binding domain-containing protein n=1 Tax=Rathayibacter soli TaxID=3144168 RepID=UPI0027E44BF9|nr:antitoxin Xre/MbcA/ParS toxin-binding domain-containing protein [Glaciibacter superstes]
MGARTSVVWGSEPVLSWLSHPNAFRDGATPIDILRERGSRDVIDALDVEQAGRYA